VRCARDGNQNAISDSMSALTLAHAAMTAAGYNVRINLQTLDDKSAAEKMLTELGELEKRATAAESEIKKAMQERAQIG
jgi:formiminotetrahydrofolate cyclodeaminase